MAERKPSKPRVLVIDDGEAYARAVREHMPELQLVAPPGSEHGRMPDGPSALRWLERHARDVDLVLLDMQFDVSDEQLLPLEIAAQPASPRRTRRFQGVAILRRIRAHWPELPVVLLTSQEDLALIDADAELAAYSLTYVLDGDDIDALRVRVHAALEERALFDEDSEVLWGRDPSMLALRRRLMVLARGSLPLILEGETGTGKSYLAERFVHRQSGRSGPFVVLDLSTVPRDLLPAQLFGVVRGAFTGAVSDRKGVFEAAHGGTLFLDEIQNATLETQKQLLLVLQDRRVRPLGATREVPVDVKVVAASNAKLADAVADGRFRADLYMRLSPATRVLIPPLRERRSDLRFFMSRMVEAAVEDRDLAELKGRVARAVGLAADAKLTLRAGQGDPMPNALELHLPPAALKRLEAHAWPGNLRELAMVMHNAVAFTLVAAADALASGIAIKSTRLQVDAGLLGMLLAGASRSASTSASDSDSRSDSDSDSGSDPDSGSGSGSAPTDSTRDVPVRLNAARTLNGVAQDVERQYMLALFSATRGSFPAMAELLLGDATRTRAVRLRFNQLGLRVRALRQT
jgi:two-component system nitrogen regulation response regulator GlnG